MNLNNKFFITLFFITVFSLINSNICYNNTSFASDDTERQTTFVRGGNTLEIRVTPDQSGLAAQKYNHPCHFTKAEMVDILASVYFKNNDMIMNKVFKPSKEGNRVFQGDEIEKLAPLIIHAFSIATPEEDILINSKSKRFLLEGLDNIFSLFMTGDRLNIVFSAIRKKGSSSLSSVIKTRNLERNTEPTKVTDSPFWELMPKKGQQLLAGHKNWLLIDYKNEMFVQQVEQKKQEKADEYKKGFKPLVDPLEDRIKKLEEMLAKSDKKQLQNKTIETNNGFNSIQEDSLNNKKTVHNSQPKQKPKLKQKLKNGEDITRITEKFFALHELLKESLITFDDYDQKKSELLEDLLSHDVKSSLKELIELKENGFITSEDFDRTKTNLLDNM